MSRPGGSAESSPIRGPRLGPLVCFTEYSELLQELSGLCDEEFVFFCG